MASIAQVRYPPPTPTGWDEWIFAHAQHHDAIERGLASVLGVAPVVYPLFPFFEKDQADWVRQHQAAHARFTSLLQINGQDLSNLDLHNRQTLDAWLWENFIEHLAAGQRLGTTIT